MKDLNLSKERKLILLLTNNRLQERDLNIIENLVTNPLDWNQIFIDTLWHKISFLILSKLKKFKLINKALTEGNLSLLLLNHWKQLFYANYERNNLYLDELKKIDISFKESNVKYAVAKGGPLLFGKIYSLYERKVYDIDIIASKDQHHLIKKCLNNLGYKYLNYNHDEERFIEIERKEVKKWLLFTRGLPNFVKPVDNIGARYLVIQVQFKIGSTKSGEHSIQSKPLLERSIQYSNFNGVGDEDLLIQLILHIYRETVEESFKEWNMDWNLIKFCDLDYFLHYLTDNKGLNFDRFYNRLIELNFCREAIYSLLLTSIIYPSKIYLNIIKDLIKEDDNLKGFKEHIEKNYFPEINAQIFKVGYNKETNKSAWNNLMQAKTT